MDFSEWPKIELHLHLDCSLGFAVVNEFEPGITTADFQHRFTAPPKCQNLSDFLSRVEDSIQLLQTERALTAATLDLLAQLQADNVIYAEIRFAPLLHTQKGLAAAEVVEIVSDALAIGIGQTGVEAGLLLCTLRNYSAEQSLETVHLAHRFRHRRVVGFDIAGDELAENPQAHEAAYAFARQHAIPCTAHAGEARGPESIWETLRYFQPGRIGHGVRCVEDPALVDYLVKKPHPSRSLSHQQRTNQRFPHPRRSYHRQTISGRYFPGHQYRRPHDGECYAQRRIPPPAKYLRLGAGAFFAL